MRVLEAEDGSRNFIWDRGEGQALEARYVVRDKGELICYLSSQTACMRACRMCHLTRTGQVHPSNATLDDFMMQAKTVMDYADNGSFDRIGFNFMARGEPLDNPTVRNTLLTNLGELALFRGIKPRFKISTIMPQGIRPSLMALFPLIHPDIYYSLYSVRTKFLKRWFPKAIDPQAGLRRLREWQEFSHKIPRIHLALIKGENDGAEELEDLCTTIKRSEVRVDFNIVRYNPYDNLSEEGDWQLAKTVFENEMPDSKVKVIPRVGYEAKASCGMFV